MQETGGDELAAVRKYFDTAGFERWNKIYGETDEVNKVQLDIRKGHAQTVDKVLRWLDAGGRGGRGHVWRGGLGHVWGGGRCSVEVHACVWVGGFGRSGLRWPWEGVRVAESVPPCPPGTIPLTLP